MLWDSLSNTEQFVILHLQLQGFNTSTSPRIQACDTRPFPRERVGSGYETTIQAATQHLSALSLMKSALQYFKHHNKCTRDWCPICTRDCYKFTANLLQIYYKFTTNLLQNLLLHTLYDVLCVSPGSWDGRLNAGSNWHPHPYCSIHPNPRPENQL